MNMRFALLSVTLLLNIGVYSVMAQGKDPKSEMSREEKERWEKLLPGTPAQKQQQINQIQQEHQIDSQVRNDPSGMGRTMAQYIAEMRQNIGDENRFNLSALSFRRAIETAETSSVSIPPDQANQAAELFIEKIRGQGNRGFMNRSFFLHFMAAHASSPKVRAFIKGKLRLKGNPDRADLLQGLYHGTSFKGDKDMSAALIDAYKAVHPKDFQLLAVVARADPDSVIPTLNDEIKAARSVKDFNTLASVACTTRKPSALDSVITRVFDFPAAPAGSDASPTLGIYAEQLLDYVKQAEDVKLEKALKVVTMTGGARIHSRDIVLSKLDSANARSRKAAYDYFGVMFRSGDFADAELLTELRKRAGAENVSEVKKAANAAIDVLERRIGR